MKRQAGLIVAALAALSLVACGGAEKGDRGGKSKRKVRTETTEWKAIDACALLDKADVGAALKDKVTETSLGGVREASGPDAATSECTYKLASGGRVTFMARWSPIGDNTPEAMAMARSATAESLTALGKTLEDVPGLGKSAFFVPGINQLNVFAGDDRFMILTIGNVSEETAKATATELVKKVID